jgi:hypothetical protein
MIGQVAMTSVAAQITAGKNGRMIPQRHADQGDNEKHCKYDWSKVILKKHHLSSPYKLWASCDASVLVDRRRLRGPSGRNARLAELASARTRPLPRVLPSLASPKARLKQGELSLEPLLPLSPQNAWQIYKPPTEEIRSV